MGDTKKSIMTEEEMAQTRQEEKKVQARLEVITKEYVDLAGHLSSSLGIKNATQINELIEAMKRLINENNALLTISRNIRKARRTSLLPARKTNLYRIKTDLSRR